MSHNMFSYTNNHDRQSMAVVVVLLLLILGIIVLVGSRTDASDEGTADSAVVATKRVGADNATPAAQAEQRKAELFSFDPNTASEAELLRLGLSRYVAQNILRWRGNGGVFQRPTDLARIYGITAGEYRRLEPYIHIAENFRPAREVIPAGNNRESTSSAVSGNTSHSTLSSTSASSDQSTAVYPQKLRSGETVSINSADTLLLQKIPGVGPYFARKIYRYREQLGGFVRKEQLTDIEGFPESALPYINIEPSAVHRLNVNKATHEQLRRHPYINFRQAQAITDYRRLRGSISSIQTLRSLRVFTDSDLQRLLPYLEY